MRSAIKILAAIALACLGPTAGAIPVSTGHAAPAPAGSSVRAGSVAPAARGQAKHEFLMWSKDLNEALMRGAAENRPVLVYATMPNCVFCRQFEQDALADQGIQALMDQFALVEIDITQDKSEAARFQVTGTPTMVLLASDGHELRRVEGLMDADALGKELREALSGHAAEATAAQLELRQVGELLAGTTVPKEKWPFILAAMGRQTSARQSIAARILAMSPPPRADLVELLASPQFATRLGALELLEQMAGSDFDFDPWQGAPDADVVPPSLARWRAWAADPRTSNIVYSALSPAQMRNFLQDLAGGSREQADRAGRALRLGGAEVAAEAEAFLHTHTNLPAGAASRIRAVRFATLLPSRPGFDAQGLAQRLVFGTLDQQMQALRDLKPAGTAATPVLDEFLAHPSSLLRETSVEMMLALAGREALPRMKELAGTEKDREVIVAMARGIGRLRNRDGQAVLALLLKSDDEDVKIAALAALAKIGSRQSADEIVKGLDDPRWRVRVATLMTVKELQISAAAPATERLISDPDTFVRYTAIVTLPSVMDHTKAAKLLAIAFTNGDELKGPVVAAYTAMGESIPPSFTSDLMNKKAEVILPVLEAMGSAGSRGLALAATFATNSDPDVSCAALRILAEDGMRIPAHRRIVLDKLANGSREQVRAILDTMREDTQRIYTSIPSSDETDMEDMLAEVDARGSGPLPPGANELASLFDAFADAVKKNNPKTFPQPTTTVNDLFDAFGATGAAPAAVTATPIATTPAGTSGDRQALTSILLKRMEGDQDAGIRRMAALRLAASGNDAALGKLSGEMDALSTGERAALAQACGTASSSARSLDLLKRLIRDPAAQVRAAAVDALCQNIGLTAWCDTLMQELLREGTSLKPSDVYTYQYRAVAPRTARGNLRRWQTRMITNAPNTAIRILGITSAELNWSSDSAALIAPFATSDDVYLRRAALHALCNKDQSKLAEHFEKASADTSPEIREIIPAVVNRIQRRWTVRFGAGPGDRAEGESMTMFSSTRQSLLPHEKKALEKLEADPIASIRVDALLARMSAGERIDARQLVAAVNAGGAVEADGARVTEILERVYLRLDASYAPLLPMLDYGRLSDDARQRIVSRLSGSRPGMTVAATAVRPDTAQPTSAPASTGTVAVASIAARPIELIFFHEDGCDACERTIGYLKVLRETFPELKVEEHDMALTASHQLLKAYDERFAVPDAKRGKVPALFTGAGSLVTEEVTLERLSDLITRAIDTPLTRPAPPAKP